MGFSGFLRIIRGKAGIPVLFVSAALLISPGSAAENEVSDRFSGGAGVEGDPYIVETVEQLQEIKNHVDGHFLLGADIDASATAEWNLQNSYEGVVIGEAGEAVEYRLPHSPVKPGSVRIYAAGLERTVGFSVDYERGKVVFEKGPAELYSLAEENGKAELKADYETAYDHYAGFEPVRRFEGVFDGGGRVISGLYINRPGTSYVALFGDTRPGSKISDLGISDADITGDTRVGGLAGNSYSVIERCYTTGRVYGNWRVGGITGVNFAGEISDSYSHVEVEGPGTVKGGLVGLQYQSVLKNSYSTGSVSGDTGMGGLLGTANTGGGFEAANSFWDTEASGLPRTGGMTAGTRIEGKTTAEMQSMETFSGAGWDISAAGEHAGETWKIEDGRDYPRLGWE